jgi:hypothetical protein
VRRACLGAGEIRLRPARLDEHLCESEAERRVHDALPCAARGAWRQGEYLHA